MKIAWQGVPMREGIRLLIFFLVPLFFSSDDEDSQTGGSYVGGDQATMFAAHILPNVFLFFSSDDEDSQTGGSYAGGDQADKEKFARLEFYSALYSHVLHLYTLRVMHVVLDSTNVHGKCLTDSK